MKKILLILAVLAVFVPAAQAQKVKETRRFAVKGTDTLFVDRHVDLSKVKGDLIPTMIYMYGGGWAFGGEDPCPIEAAALALWGCRNSKRDPNRTMRIG